MTSLLHRSSMRRLSHRPTVRNHIHTLNWLDGRCVIDDKRFVSLIGQATLTGHDAPITGDSNHIFSLSSVVCLTIRSVKRYCFLFFSFCATKFSAGYRSRFRIGRHLVLFFVSLISDVRLFSFSLNFCLLFVCSAADRTVVRGRTLCFNSIQFD